MLEKKQRRVGQPYPILNLDVLVEKESWWVILEYIFSGKLRGPEDILNS